MIAKTPFFADYLFHPHSTVPQDGFSVTIWLTNALERLRDTATSHHWALRKDTAQQHLSSEVQRIHQIKFKIKSLNV